MQIPDLPALMTVAETASFLRLDVDLVAEAVALGDLPLVVVDGEVRVDTDQLLFELGVQIDRPIRLAPTDTAGTTS
jgi:hypothetical protein